MGTEFHREKNKKLRETLVKTVFKKIIMELNQLTEQILKCAYKVHTALGPGVLESAYEECLFYELKMSGLIVEKQKPMPLIYEEVKLDIGYRIDLWWKIKLC